MPRHAPRLAGMDRCGAPLPRHRVRAARVKDENTRENVRSIGLPGACRGARSGFDGPVAEELRLRDTPRLEDEATFGLVELLDSERKDWSEHVLSVASDRFERRLAQELGAFKSDVSKTLNEVAAGIRQDTATARLEMLKWSFVFWIGQVAAVAGLLAFMRR